MSDISTDNPVPGKQAKAFDSIELLRGIWGMIRGAGMNKPAGATARGNSFSRGHLASERENPRCCGVKQATNGGDP
nr:hypothetical protein [Citrobacter freundii]